MTSRAGLYGDGFRLREPQNLLGPGGVYRNLWRPPSCGQFASAEEIRSASIGSRSLTNLVRTASGSATLRVGVTLFKSATSEFGLGSHRLSSAEVASGRFRTESSNPAPRRNGEPGRPHEQAFHRFASPTGAFFLRRSSVRIPFSSSLDSSRWAWKY